MGALLAQRLATRIQPLAMVLLTPAPPRGINALTPAVIGAFAPWMFSGMFWRNAHKPGFAHARRFAFNGVPEDRHRALYENLVHESGRAAFERSEEHTSELQSLMRNSSAVFCLNKKNNQKD